MKRREFLRNTGWFVVGASLVGMSACSDDNPSDTISGPGDSEIDPPGTYGFPQGVASGDPREASVVVWTRVVRTAATSDTFIDVTVRVQLSTDPAFGTLLVDEAVLAVQASDHTVRVLITNLSAKTTYHYRFVAGQETISGQTRTAPAANDEAQVNLAWVSCQDYSAGHYGAYRQMLVDDAARAPADQIHAVVHLGDMIYETRGDAFQTALDDSFQPIALTNRDGTPRQVGAFPSGGGQRAGLNFAAKVDDYRHLYKTFLADPDLQAARARWPFVSIWDDHEFTDDCWQSQANYDNARSLDEGDQTRRMAASQAWFEYVPVQLTGATGVPGVASQAKDFKAATVVDAAFTDPDADNFVEEPNNAAAIDAITIYRSLRFGQHVELVMTDERSYRSDHAVPEDLFTLVGPPLFFTPRNVLPLELVNTFDAGKTSTADDGSPPKMVFGQIPNLRIASPAGTILGKQQKQWWKDTMKGSDATWKLWGNEVTLMRLKIEKLAATDPSDRVVTADSWDGYPTERNELMGYLRDEAIQNVVVLTGDIHAAFAGTVMDNFDAATPVPVACELVGPGVTSNSLYSFVEFATRALVDPGPAPDQIGLHSLVATDTTAQGGSKFTENLNLLLLEGTTAAGTFAGAIKGGATVAQALGAAAAANTAPNPHLRYVDTNAQGYGYIKITGEQVAASITTINRPIAAPSDAGPGAKRIASFTIQKDDPDSMALTGVTGTKPFPT